MNWKNLFTPVANLNAAEAKEFMATRKSGDYQLLDVRQPKEYEAGHLAGAKLIPVKELPDRLAELERDKPVIVYCAVGGRSRAAAQLLAGKDFANVFNLSGGIKAWEGRQVTGPEEAGLELFVGVREYDDAVALAYAMEDGLQQFYRKLAAAADDAEHKALYERLAGFEDKHKARLVAEYRNKHGDELVPVRELDVMEGGRHIDAFLARAKALIGTRQDILEFAMALETQALDLYSRMAQKSDSAETRDFFLGLADEEKLHLSYLARELDKVL